MVWKLVGSGILIIWCVLVIITSINIDRASLNIILTSNIIILSSNDTNLTAIINHPRFTEFNRKNIDLDRQNSFLVDKVTTTPAWKTFINRSYIKEAKAINNQIFKLSEEINSTK